MYACAVCENSARAARGFVRLGVVHSVVWLSRIVLAHVVELTWTRYKLHAWYHLWAVMSTLRVMLFVGRVGSLRWRWLISFQDLLLVRWLLSRPFVLMTTTRGYPPDHTAGPTTGSPVVSGAVRGAGPLPGVRLLSPYSRRPRGLWRVERMVPLVRVRSAVAGAVVWAAPVVAVPHNLILLWCVCRCLPCRVLLRVAIIARIFASCVVSRVLLLSARGTLTCVSVVLRICVKRVSNLIGAWTMIRCRLRPRCMSAMACFLPVRVTFPMRTESWLVPAVSIGTV